MNSRGLLLTLELWLSIYGALAAPSNQENDNANKTLNSPEICDTQGCFQISNAFKISMNESIEPCDDFYEYACGNWEASRPFSEYEKRWSRFEEFESLIENRVREELESPSSSEDISPVQQVKKWYRSCMNESRESLDSINSILLRTGGWPMIMGPHAWNRGSRTWQEIDRHHRQLNGDNTFYATQVTTHMGYYDALQINNPGFPLSEVLPLNPRNLTNDDGIFYRSIMKSVAQLFIEQYNAHVSDEELEKDIDDLIKFEEKLYKASQDTSIKIEEYKHELSNIHFDKFIEWWNNRTESIATTPEIKIDWPQEFQGLFDIAKLTLNTSIKIEIESIGYLINLLEILNSTDERTIVNYIQWNFVSKIFKYMNDDMKDIYHKIVKRQKSIPERPPRWVECVREIQMRDAASYLFLKKYFSNNTEKAVNNITLSNKCGKVFSDKSDHTSLKIFTARISEMLENIKESVEFQITNLTWLSSDSKISVKEKINYITHSIGYPSWYNNESAFIDLYKGLEVGENYLENNLNFLRYKKVVELRKFNGQKLPLRWPMDGLKVNAVFEPIRLTMMITGATVQPPLFGSKVPDYVNYGTVGSIIGHEISHAFDLMGIIFLGARFWPRLNNDEMKIYDLRLECFIEMFDKNYRGYNNTIHKSFDKSSMSPERLEPIYKYLRVEENRDRINEFFSDSSGVKATFHAYREFVNGAKKRKQLKLPGFEKFTDEQMFFLSYSQIFCGSTRASLGKGNTDKTKVHASGRTRVIGTLSNSLAFTEAFHCKKGSSMNRENKCDVWSECNMRRKLKLLNIPL